MGPQEFDRAARARPLRIRPPAGRGPQAPTPPMTAAGQSARPWVSTMQPSRGWRGRHGPWPNARNSAGWIIFAGTVAMVLLFAVSAVMLPMTNVTLCTAGFETCITHSRSQPWHVEDTPCPTDQSEGFVRPVVFVRISRCHSIRVSGFSTPLDVCPAACAK